MKITFKPNAKAWKIADKIEQIKDNATEQIHYDISVENGSIVMNIRKGEFPPHLLLSKHIRSVED